MKCQPQFEALGVDTPHPALRWTLTSDVRGDKQTAYRVLVASRPELLKPGKADLWDSKKVESDNSINVPYVGATLGSSAKAYWKVQVWDKDGKATPWSKTQSWTMGVLKEGDWKAKWIGSPVPSETVLLRREFKVKPGLARAVVHACGLGCYEMTLNGAKVGKDLFPPGWTNFRKTCLYDTHDITRQLREGSNAIGLLLGNGMYNVKGGRYTKFTGTFGPLKAIALVVLDYMDGKREVIGTDSNWQSAPGPITFSCVFGGEDFDSRLEQKGWDEPGFKAGWANATVVDSPGGKLVGLSKAAPPIRAFETLKPIRKTKLSDKATIYDLGQNASLMIRLQTKGPKGAVVRLIPAELLHKDSSADRGSCGGGEAYWQYTLSGDGVETYVPKFFYHGSRYIQVEVSSPEGQPLPVVKKLDAVVVHGDAKPVGDFVTSDDLFNRIRTLVRWAQRSNIMSVLTDCPHRERLGWLEQVHLNGPSLRYEFDIAGLFSKAMGDMADSQTPDGLIPDIAPEYVVFDGGFRDSPEWGSAFIIGAWQQYEWTGETAHLERYYGQMVKYVNYLASKAKDGIVSHGLGDWYDIGPGAPGYAQLTPIALTATAFYYQDVHLMAQIAGVLKRKEDASTFDAAAKKIRDAFIAKFHEHATASQAANAIALNMGLIEDSQRPVAIDSLVKDIKAKGLTAGDVGYRYVLQALAKAGRSDVVFDMNHESTKPGYGYQLAHGATSLTEAWDTNPSSSQNHFMLGHIVEWFYGSLLGIRPDPDEPGFKRVIFEPSIVGGIRWAKGHHDSRYGRIEFGWSVRNGLLTLDVSLPPNTTGVIRIPTSDLASVKEGGLGIAHTKGVRLLGVEGGQVVLQLGSGRYRLTASAQ